MSNPYYKPRLKRTSRLSSSSSLQTGDLSPEAAQQVENFVDILTDLLGDQTDASAEPQKKPVTSQANQTIPSWQKQEESETPKAAAEPSTDVDLEATELSDSQPSPETTRAASDQTVLGSKPAQSLGTSASVPPQAMPTRQASGYVQSKQSPHDNGESNVTRDRPQPVSAPSSLGVSTHVPEEIDPSTATIETTKLDPSESALASTHTAEGSALVLSTAQPLPVQSASDTNVNSASVGEELDHLRNLLVGVEEQIYDPDKLVRLLLPAVSEAIRDRLKSRQSAIANVLRPEMAIPIQEQIAIERDTIIDALYPVVGATVAEYFTETLRTLNSRVANTAVEGKAADLEDQLLSTPKAGSKKRNSDSLAVVQAVLLIHKSTGLLLAQTLASREIAPTVEKQAEVLTAIRSAANAKLEQLKLEEASTKAGKYRSGQILVEFSESCYLAALVKGDPPVSFLRQMRQVLGEILAAHGDFIASFEGNVDAVPETITPNLRRLLNAHAGAGKHRRPRLLIGLGFLLLGGIVAGFWGLQEWRYRRVRAFADEVQRTAALLNQGSGVSITAQISDKQVVVEGEVLQFNDVQEIVQSFERIPGVEAVIDRVEAKPLTIPTQVYFYTGSTAISPRDIAGKITDITNLLNQNPEYHLKIIGYRNPTAEAETPDLALSRALTVADALADQGIARQRLEAVMSAGIPPGVNVEYQPWLSQAVLFEIVRPVLEE